MAEITTSIIMDLRARTNAGMMDCKRALTETNGDMEEAIKLLRMKGQAIQVKRASKEANQGLVEVGVSADGRTVALVEVNCETDFVAKTDNFKKFVRLVADTVLNGTEDVAGTLKDKISELVSSTGENLKIGRTARFTLGEAGAIESYIHMGGKVGVIVEVGCGKAETTGHAAFTTLVHDVALQIAAAAPRWLQAGDVTPETVESEKALYRQQMEGENKPANVIEKIIEGKIRKFFGEVCLIDQPFVKEPKQTVKQIVEAAGKAAGDTIVIRRFARFQIGSV
ncbi:MAG: translation elongation factor Ts [Lentisphaerae bacterium]|nr:translation elongation factor Ts [Lentisphaerota bacterium]